MKPIRRFISNVQVMLLSDRLAVWNPGTQPHGLFPGNPLIAAPLYPTRYIERDQVGILHKCFRGQAIQELMEIAGLTDRTRFRTQVLRHLLNAGFIEMTITAKPTSSKRNFRLPEAGKQILNQDAWVQSPATDVECRDRVCG
ncbi:MAG: Fic family protein [Thermodesulfobacteriota bacterium]